MPLVYFPDGSGAPTDIPLRNLHRMWLVVKSGRADISLVVRIGRREIRFDLATIDSERTFSDLPYYPPETEDRFDLDRSSSNPPSAA